MTHPGTGRVDLLVSVAYKTGAYSADRLCVLLNNIRRRRLWITRAIRTLAEDYRP
jgi:hypothetical protein